VDNLGKMIKSTKVFNIKILSTWISSITKIEYPSTLQLTIDNVIYIIEPKLKNQEFNSKTLGGLSYWEGACSVKNIRGELIGNAYLEFTGYIK
jgi:predicted secreted hydrolase